VLEEFFDAIKGTLKAIFYFILYFHIRINYFYSNRRSKASDPGLIKISYSKLKRLCPENFASGIDPLDWLDQVAGERAIQNFLVADQLIHGDSRAAVVMSVFPLLVAAYTQELDCIVMLRFPDELVGEYGLKVRSRLLTVNRYHRDWRSASDIEEGRLSYNRYSNFQPFIADFLSDDWDRLAARKASIIEDEWTRAWVMGGKYLAKFGDVARDGRPSDCSKEAPIPDRSTLE
jgi:hypothetical protein